VENIEFNQIQLGKTLIKWQSQTSSQLEKTWIEGMGELCVVKDVCNSTTHAAQSHPIDVQSQK
jgi:hypothetical protein